MQLGKLLLFAAAFRDVVHDRREKSLLAEVDLAERKLHRKRASVPAPPVDLSGTSDWREGVALLEFDHHFRQVAAIALRAQRLNRLTKHLFRRVAERLR